MALQNGCCLTKNEIKKLDKLTREVENHQYDHYQFSAEYGGSIPFLDLSKDQQEKMVEILENQTKTFVALLKYKIVLCERHPKEDE